MRRCDRRACGERNDSENGEHFQNRHGSERGVQNRSPSERLGNGRGINSLTGSVNVDAGQVRMQH